MEKRFKVGDWVKIKINTGITFAGEIGRISVVKNREKYCYVVDNIGMPFKGEELEYIETPKYKIGDTVVHSSTKPSTLVIKGISYSEKGKTFMYNLDDRIITPEANITGLTTSEPTMYNWGLPVIDNPCGEAPIESNNRPWYTSIKEEEIEIIERFKVIKIN